MDNNTNELSAVIAEAVDYVKQNPGELGNMIGGIQEAVSALSRSSGIEFQSTSDFSNGDFTDVLQWLNLVKAAEQSWGQAKQSEILSSMKELTRLCTRIYNQNNETRAELSKLKLQYNELKAGIEEILWANIFNSTTCESDFLINKTFAPGRWAAGYPFLYALYRVLRDTKPGRILELGLGETTRVISQYSAKYQAEHFIVEHDPEWISFFTNSFKMSENTEIIQLPWAFETYKEASNIRVYKDFARRLANGKYDLIVIDGPLGGDMRDYARIDVLSLLPEHLSDSFAILIDDYERPGERNTAKEIVNILGQAGRTYVCGLYSGSKATIVICSEDKKFLTSL